MTALRIRPQADRDTDAIADQQAVEANLDLGLQFFAAVELAYERVASHPQAGSPFLAFDIRRIGLRYWPVPGFERASRAIACRGQSARQVLSDIDPREGPHGLAAA